MKSHAQGPFYCLAMYYRAREDDPNTRGQDCGDRFFMQCADPVPNLSTACRMAWFVLGQRGLNAHGKALPRLYRAAQGTLGGHEVTGGSNA